MDKTLTYENTMGNLKDDVKKMDPLFPKLHISDADKGAPRISSRNKMALSTSGLVPTYHDASYKRSVFSSFGSSCGSTRLATRLDSYRSSGINLNISLTTVKQTIETTNCQTLCNTGHLKQGDNYHLFKPQDLKTTIKKVEDEDNEDNPVPSMFNSLIKQENKPYTMMIRDIAREHVSSYSDKARFSETLPLSPIKRSIVVDEADMLHHSTIRLPMKRKNFQETMGYEDGMLIWPILGDWKTDKDVHEVLNNSGSLQITPNEVSEMIGDDQYSKARRTIIEQQRVFNSQLFELHRLIKVQKRLAESAHYLSEDRGYGPKNMPSEGIIFPIDGTVTRQFQSKNDTHRRYNRSTLLDFPQPSTINGGKQPQPPWCLIPPPGNQWLVPMTSPSEGLVYKPYTGPCPPPVGLMAQIYGSRDFINDAYPQGIGVLPHNPLYTSYGLPAITKGFCPTSMEDNMKYNKPVKTLCNNTLPLEKWPTISDVQNLQDSKERDNLQGSSKRGDELPLFPTSPVLQDSDQCTGEKGFDEGIKVIKVVPRNPKLASESAARIFQFIQEERKRNE